MNIRPVKSWISLVRPVNLLIIALTMSVILWRYEDEVDSEYLLHCLLLVIPAVLTAAAGYIVNDIYDVEADKINKPAKSWVGVTIGKRQAWIAYALINAISLVLSYLSSEMYAIINACVITLLFFYSLALKGTPLLGNILVAMCSAAVVACPVLVATFDTSSAFLNFGGYIIFAFFISLIRELVKDIQDVEGDQATSYRTYPVIAGVKGAKIIAYAFCGIQILFCGIYSVIAWGVDLYISSVIMGIITLGLFYFINRLSKAKTYEAYGNCSLLLKCLMFAGVINLIFS